VATHPEESKPLTNDTEVKQGNVKTPGEEGKDGVTVVESTTELLGSTSPCMTVEAPLNSQQSHLVLDKSS
jgi:hypothetical protein